MKSPKTVKQIIREASVIFVAVNLINDWLMIDISKSKATWLMNNCAQELYISFESATREARINRKSDAKNEDVFIW